MTTTVVERGVRKITCPVCKEKSVTVSNSCGMEGDRKHDYLANHGPTGKLCPASERYLYDIERGDLRELCPPLD